MREEQKRIDPLSFQGMPDEKKLTGMKRGNDSTGQHLAKANNLLAELEEEDK